MKQALSILVICVICFCCKKHASSALTINWPCDITMDSTALANGILGSWNWTKSTGQDGKIHPADKNIKVTFNTNATYTVKENATIITQGTWKVEAASSSQWQLNLSEPNQYLRGWASVCQNQIAFLDGYIDGPDNYFEKGD